MLPIFAKGNKNTIRKLIRLRKEAIKEKKYWIATRMHAIILSLEGHTTGQIAKILKVNRTGVPVWINNWNGYKEEGLLEGYHSGRKTKMNHSDFESLYDIIESGPVAYGLNTGVWTSPIIASVIEDEFAITYHPGHVRKILKRIGFSVQRPALSLSRAETKKKNRWVRYEYPDLKKKRRKNVR